VWPSDYAESVRDLELLRLARVVAVDECGRIEFPHRSIQEFFAALAVLQEEGAQPRDASAAIYEPSDRTAGSDGLTDRDIVLSVLLSPTAPPPLKAWALRNTDWSSISI